LTPRVEQIIDQWGPIIIAVGLIVIVFVVIGYMPVTTAHQ